MKKNLKSTGLDYIILKVLYRSRLALRILSFDLWTCLVFGSQVQKVERSVLLTLCSANILGFVVLL